MIETLTQVIHILVIFLSTTAVLKGADVYFSRSNELSRTLNKFVIYSTVTSFFILLLDIYRLTIDQPYVGGIFAVFAYLTQLVTVLLALNIIKTAKQVADEY